MFYWPIDKIPEIGQDSSKVPPRIWKIFQVKIGWDFIQVSTVVTMLWQDSNKVMTFLSPTSGTSRRLQNHESMSLWFLHSDRVLLGT